jgi:hypothetical protein
VISTYGRETWVEDWFGARLLVGSPINLAKVVNATRVNLKIFKTKTIVVGSLLVLVLLKPL